MTISIDKAREFVHAGGTMWERALWDHLFDGGPLGRVHDCLRVYRNDDGGWGHGLEHDIKCPSSNTLALEFLLMILRDTGLPPGDLLDGAGAWVEANQGEDGWIADPDDLLSYPHAPWHKDGHRWPMSVTGQLTRHGGCPPRVAERTRAWAGEHLTTETIAANEWLFMCYRAHDYYLYIEDHPDLEAHREATLANIAACATAHEEKGEREKLFPLFQFATTPEGVVAKAMPDGMVDRFLDHLAASQRDDGGWDDEHGLAHWHPYFSTVCLLALKRYGRL